MRRTELLEQCNSCPRGSFGLAGLFRFTSQIAATIVVYKHAPQGCRVFGGMGFIVVIEVDPESFRPARFDPGSPRRQFAF